MRSRHIIVVTGLKREARMISGPSALVIAGGGDVVRLNRNLEAATAGSAGIISIGLGGALAEGLRPGDWVVGRGVHMQQGRVETDQDWSETLLDRLPGARAGDVAGSDVMVADAAGKRALYDSTGALVVDMESHVAARVAARHGLPFAVARTISDSADHSLPIAAQRGMRPDGGMDIAAVLLALLGDPAQLPALIRTALAAETAFRALLRGRQLLGPALGRPDLG